MIAIILFYLFIAWCNPIFASSCSSDEAICDQNEEACCLDFVDCEAPKCIRGRRLLIGPEAYHVHRRRKGGTKQHGGLYGLRAVYDHIKRHRFYIGIEGACSEGILRGKSASDNYIKSKVKESTIEGRFGFTFQGRSWQHPTLTPFIGIGWFWEKSSFQPPSPICCHFKTSYRYATAGFISSLQLTRSFNIGFNLKVRYMLDPKCKITRDPDINRASLKIGNDALQYRIELPLTYTRCSCQKLSVALVPFYERRHYGGQAAFPFDFMKTVFINYGATLFADYSY